MWLIVHRALSGITFLNFKEKNSGPHILISILGGKNPFCSPQQGNNIDC
jgi:hypothetical protein